MIQSIRFQHDVLDPIKRLAEVDGLDISEETLQRVVEITFNFFGCLPGREMAQRLDVAIAHGIEACGGS